MKSGLLGFNWNAGELNRSFGAYRPCSCRVCREQTRGVGYLSSSDTRGRGFTIWIEDEAVFQRLKAALRRHERQIRSEDLSAHSTAIEKSLLTQNKQHTRKRPTLL